MTRFLPVLMLLVLAVGCERDFKAGTGYGPGVGYSGAGMTYASGGGVLPLEEIADGASTPEDTATPQDTAGQDVQQGDQGCTGSSTYCECMTAFNSDLYCACLDTEDAQHTGEPLWCMCHHLVCVTGPEPGLSDLYLADCIESYPQDCL